MSKYGLPYMGSKDKIADELLEQMPAGKRLVDLFGGGFTMSHAALLSGKYEQVFYSELNPLLPQLITTRRMKIRKNMIMTDLIINTFMTGLRAANIPFTFHPTK